MSDAEKARVARLADAASIVVRRVGRWLRFERENISEESIETKQFGDYVTYADKTANSFSVCQASWEGGPTGRPELCLGGDEPGHW